MSAHKPTVHNMLSGCLLIGLLTPTSEAFSSPRPYHHPVRCKNTRCHVLPSFKQRRKADNNILNKEDFESGINSITNGSSYNLFGSFKPLMQPELDMEDVQTTNETVKVSSDSSSSQLVLIGGTALVLAAAFALGVSMSTELGIDLEWR